MYRSSVPSTGGDAFATATAHEATLWTGDPELLLEDAPWNYEDLRDTSHR